MRVQLDEASWEAEPRPRSFSERDDVAEIEATLLSELRKVAKGTVTATTAFHELGLSSGQMVELLRQVEVAWMWTCRQPWSFRARPCARSRTRSSASVALYRGAPVVQESDGDDVGGRMVLRLPGACDAQKNLIDLEP